jgi:hypothetical protein
VGNMMIFPYKWGTEGPLTQRNGEFSKQDVDFGGLNWGEISLASDSRIL